jgi:hypothetical protein
MYGRKIEVKIKHYKAMSMDKNKDKNCDEDRTA